MSEEKLNKNKTKVFKYITISVVMVIVIGFIFSPLYISAITSPDGSKLSSISELAQITMNIFGVFGVIVALWQYIIYSRRELELKDKEIFDMDKARIQKAIDMAGYYKENILDPLSAIAFAWEVDTRKLLMQKIKFSEVQYFDMNEVKQYLSDKEIETLKDIHQDPKFQELLFQVSMVDPYWKDWVNEIEVREDGELVKKVKVKKASVLYAYHCLLESILNRLEFFSMHFIKQTADDTVVYQSLHNSFIDIVSTLYFEISRNNSGGSEKKLYTNVIELYCKWRDAALIQKNEELASARSHVISGTKLKIN